MNRAERRKTDKKQRVRTYTLTQAQIDEIKLNAVRDALDMLMYIPVMVLHDKFGFGQIRQDRFLHYVYLWAQSVQDGEITLAEIREAALKCGGVRVIVDRPMTEKR